MAKTATVIKFDAFIFEFVKDKRLMILYEGFIDISHVYNSKFQDLVFKTYEVRNTTSMAVESS
jgi:hypothetical protein